jgi:hypothetical protein
MIAMLIMKKLKLIMLISKFLAGASPNCNRHGFDPWDTVGNSDIYYLVKETNFICFLPPVTSSLANSDEVEHTSH